MRIPLYQVDAFTQRVFHGNPAAVCPLEQWLDDKQLQSIAAENNLPETAYIVRQGEQYEIRWFTPEQEIDLCGHATLASAFVIFRHLEPQRMAVTFHSKSGSLPVTKDGDRVCLDFPARAPAACSVSDGLLTALGGNPKEVLCSRDYLVVYDSEKELRSLQPDMAALKRLDRLGVIVTAASTTVDFVSRFFAPGAGIPEDPVTGSAHCTLIPYWARRLDKMQLHALQVSQRGGELFCELRKDRVRIAGHAVQYLAGSIEI